jgi:hypothetical protein
MSTEQNSRKKASGLLVVTMRRVIKPEELVAERNKREDKRT